MDRSPARSFFFASCSLECVTVTCFLFLVVGVYLGSNSSISISDWYRRFRVEDSAQVHVISDMREGERLIASTQTQDKDVLPDSETLSVSEEELADDNRSANMNAENVKVINESLPLETAVTPAISSGLASLTSSVLSVTSSSAAGATSSAPDGLYSATPPVMTNAVSSKVGETASEKASGSSSDTKSEFTSDTASHRASGTGSDTISDRRSVISSDTSSDTVADIEAPSTNGDSAPLASPKVRFTSAWHRMNDGRLKWKANRVNPNKCKAAKKKLAFMFLVRGPLPLANLWKLFFQADERQELFSVYVHAKPGHEYNRFLPDVFRHRQVPSQEVEWATISIVDAERRLLANAMLDPCNTRFVLVSEACVPLFNLSYIYHYFMDINKSFINPFDDPSPFGRGRYRPEMEPEVKVEQWRKGSAWFEVTRELALAIISDKKYYPKFQKYCVPWCFPDEHYLATFLNIEFPSKLMRRAPTFTDWSRGGSHPWTFSAGDLTETVLLRMRGKDCKWNGQSGFPCTMFARKFNPNSLGMLLKLAPTLGIS
eukprot:TRINITY_DN827_c0_g3_i1.p1 TRINITY_DN827_c0_g3~~TRINITY_DN827_c0_g3_i1.p1  ORF type:complete len:616 (+),score=20.65 TRINITY_DN827_c0_g3_i1:217-1848(+)